MMVSLLTTKPLDYNEMWISLFYLELMLRTFLNTNTCRKNIDNLYIFQCDISKERKDYQLRFSQNYAQKRLKSNFRN